MRLSHNMASFNIFRQYTKSNEKINSSVDKISSGKKLSSAKDNPYDISKSGSLNITNRSLQAASRNSQDGMSMLQTAEGGLNEMSSMLQRVRELTVKAGSGANTKEDLSNIQIEIDQMVEGIDQMADGTSFNGVTLLSKEASSTKDFVYMQIGATGGDTIKIPINNVKSDGVLDLENKMELSINGTNNMLETIDTAIDTMNSIRAKYGALENRFETSYDNTNEITEKITGALSSIEDTDIAAEMIEYSKNSILSQAATALMVQTNKMPQEILSILDKI